MKTLIILMSFCSFVCCQSLIHSNYHCPTSSSKSLGVTYKASLSSCWSSCISSSSCTVIDYIEVNDGS